MLTSLCLFQGKFSVDEYKPLTNLHTLKLGYNAIHTLKSDVFEHTPNLKSLTLDSNPFGVLDHATVMALSTLTYLEVSWHIFRDIQFMFLYSVEQKHGTCMQYMFEFSNDGES